MNVIYTVCSINHLGRALSLADSVAIHCKQTRFLICLTDTLDHDLISKGSEFIFAKDMNLPFLNEMFSKYTPLELNSALKPYFGNFIFEKYSDVDQLIFLDSDILLFSDLSPVFEALKSDSIILTPHSFTSISAGNGFDDRDFLRSGIYNAGFFALKRDKNAFAFLDWWMVKLRNQGFFDSRRGMFAEQLWMNLIPLYFENVHVLRHLGCNVAHWNMHERFITQVDSRWYINENTPLIFFHFSGATITCLEDNLVSKHHKKYNFENRPDVYPLFKIYIESLKKHSFEKYNQYYSVSSKLRVKSVLIIKIAEFLKKLTKRMLYSFRN